MDGALSPNSTWPLQLIPLQIRVGEPIRIQLNCTAEPVAGNGKLAIKPMGAVSMSKPPEAFSLAKRIRSFRYALQGLGFALASQHNFRIQLVAAVAAIVLGVVWRVSADDWRWLVIAIVMVLAAELVNTAFEHLCDVVQPELHASVKAAKDVAAGAVLVVAIGAAVIGALVFWPYLVNQFRQ